MLKSTFCKLTLERKAPVFSRVAKTVMAWILKNDGCFRRIEARYDD